ncbi:proline-rich protein HaeIII subfamily 1-like [Caloenas nicobarica]|uniref:proline-rich protein HaeIII subfamily 1-like n=1 Tax=Caloenas nicobarica TaxID=187106 RepID=UPI0032B6FB50
MLMSVCVSVCVRVPGEAGPGGSRRRSARGGTRPAPGDARTAPGFLPSGPATERGSEPSARTHSWIPPGDSPSPPLQPVPSSPLTEGASPASPPLGTPRGEFPEGGPQPFFSEGGSEPSPQGECAPQHPQERGGLFRRISPTVLPPSLFWGSPQPISPRAAGLTSRRSRGAAGAERAAGAGNGQRAAALSSFPFNRGHRPACVCGTGRALPRRPAAPPIKAAAPRPPPPRAPGGDSPAAPAPRTAPPVG